MTDSERHVTFIEHSYPPLREPDPTVTRETLVLHTSSRSPLRADNHFSITDEEGEKNNEFVIPSRLKAPWHASESLEG
jgi:hypothetical protein